MAKKRVTVIVVCIFCLLLAVVAGCESKSKTGAAVGAAGGAAAGQAIGGNTEGTLIGAGVGALGGYFIGRHMDEKDEDEEQELQKVDTADEVEEQGLDVGDTVSVNIANSDGSVRTVRLTKTEEGYVGPQGEYYETMPTIDHLEEVYGK